MHTGVIIMNEEKKGAALFDELMKKTAKEKEKRVEVEKIDKEKFEANKEKLLISLLEKKSKQAMLEFGQKKRLNLGMSNSASYFKHLVVKPLPKNVINHYLNISWDIDLKICKEKGLIRYGYTFTKIRHGVGIYTEEIFDPKEECECEI